MLLELFIDSVSDDVKEPRLATGSAISAATAWRSPARSTSGEMSIIGRFKKPEDIAL